jgi:cytochrome c553
LPCRGRSARRARAHALGCGLRIEKGRLPERAGASLPNRHADYAADVGPIVQGVCVTCHEDRGTEASKPLPPRPAQRGQAGGLRRVLKLRDAARDAPQAPRPGSASTMLGSSPAAPPGEPSQSAAPSGCADQGTLTKATWPCGGVGRVETPVEVKRTVRSGTSGNRADLIRPRRRFGGRRLGPRPAWLSFKRASG